MTDVNRKLHRALNRLLSLQDGDRGVIDVEAYGPGAIPHLRRALFTREPSGLFQPRCRVVEVLAYLGGYDALLDFLEAPHEVADPVEAAGEEAVINAAARALRHLRNERVFRVLLSLARSHALPGPVEALGDWCHPEALSCLIACLADDLARPAAEQALRRYGDFAVPALLEAATNATGKANEETESSRRRQRGVLGLLIERNAQAQVPEGLRRSLVWSDDTAVSLLGCRLALSAGGPSEQQIAVRRLIEWLCQAPWLVWVEIEDIIVVYMDVCRPIVAEYSEMEQPLNDDHTPHAKGVRALHHISAKLGLIATGTASP